VKTLWAVVLPAVLSGGCGIAETGSGATAAAESAAQQAAQARTAEQEVRGQIDDAYRKAEEQRRAAEADGQ